MTPTSVCAGFGSASAVPAEIHQDDAGELLVRAYIPGP